MKILVLGAGGREHALAQTFLRQGHTVSCFPGNGGTDSCCTPLGERWHSLDANDFSALAQLAHEEGFDLTVVGPEDALSNGVVDTFGQKGCPIFGPKKEATQLESSKKWSKAFMVKHEIPTARHYTCSTPSEARHIVDAHFIEWGGAVIKPSGLTAGKGVTCCETVEAAHSSISEIMEESRYGKAGNEVVIEEMLQGEEISILAFCDGHTVVPMISSQDHKRLYDNGRGPNTGGMGAYAPVPFVTEAMMSKINETIIKKTLEGLKNEGITYKGIIYFGLMLTEVGPYVLEYNCRFGDPEAQVVLPLLESDLAEIMLSCHYGTLAKRDVKWSNEAACAVVMASGGYPGSYEVGYPISGLESVGDTDTYVYHAGTKLDDCGSGDIVTSGGRVLAVTGKGKTIDEAISRTYKAVDGISFKFAHYRHDIGRKAMIAL